MSDADAARLRDGLAVLGVDAPTFAIAAVAAHEHVAAVRGIMRRRGVWPTVVRLAAALEHEGSLDLDDRPDLLVGLPLASA